MFNKRQHSKQMCNKYVTYMLLQCNLVVTFEEVFNFIEIFNCGLGRNF